jgi:hypothetical protein
MTGYDNTTFFRLLKTPIDDKGDVLAAQIAALNASEEAGEIYIANPSDFSLIYGSPFAYWVNVEFRRKLRRFPRFEPTAGRARRGPSTGDDSRRLRAWWEVSPDSIGRYSRWVPYPKGGHLSPYHSDISLVVAWDENRRTFLDFHGRPGREIERPECLDDFFFPGLTWPRRASRFALSAMAEGCIFSVRGQAVLAPVERLPMLLGVLNSRPFDFLFKLSLGRWGFPEFIVGVLQRLPWAEPLPKECETIGNYALDCHAARRDFDRLDEVTHSFCLPGLVHHRAGSLLEAGLTLEAETEAAKTHLAEIQAEIDDIVFDLYGLSETDRALVREEMGQPETWNLEPETPEEDDENEITPPEDLPARVQNLLMWCVGVAFGRWDVRMALDPTLLPSLQGPFDPLPRCAPGTLVGPDGLPPAQAVDIAPKAWLRARENVLRIPSSPLPVEATRAGTDQPETSNLKPQTPYPLPIAWDGILVDDPTHRSDVVTRVRGVLTLLWGDRAGAIEREACDILGFESLRDYFRDPRKGFFAFHVQRYSKSRRKAPVYWLLQSERRNYGIWLYIHRLRPDALFVAGRDYADAKVALEEARTQELRQGLDVLNGSARRRRERGIERQQRLVAEVTEFRDRLDCVALLNLPPDLNDGVTISIAPLWELVPWKEAQRTWEKLVAGEYPWSTMRQQMQKQGLVKA